MKGRDRRLGALEAHLEGSLKRRKGCWLGWIQGYRTHHLSDWKPYGQVRDIIRLLRLQGRMGTTTEELRNQLLAWQPPLEKGAIEREFARFIYSGEEGSEAMVCPPEWHESLEAADELRAKCAAIPDEVIARWMVEGKVEDLSHYGFTEELDLRVIGPDIEHISEDECRRRLLEIFVEDLCGERGRGIQQHIDRLRGRS